uniref:(northern house mosquito) hypothetical protein n=1 Tax=Culex pipiens TaxID=7175 RepID=A0A8D8ACR7_CULPI
MLFYQRPDYQIPVTCLTEGQRCSVSRKSVNRTNMETFTETARALFLIKPEPPRCTCPTTVNPSPTSRARSTGRITRNPFFNYLGHFRANHRELSPVGVSVEGARAWRRMTFQEKEPFVRVARLARRRRRGRRSSR